MSERVKWIEYKNKKILLHDYSGIRGFKGEGEALAKEIMESINNLKQYNILELIDVRDAYNDFETVKSMKEISKKIQPHVKKCAVIGVSGVKKVILDTINRFSNRKIVPFAAMEEAKEWLISED